jgi:chromosome segregation ATPase
MEDVIQKCHALYDELVKEKAQVAAIRIQQADEARSLQEKAAALATLAGELKTKANRLKVYEQIEACEKANKDEATRLKGISEAVAKDVAALVVSSESTYKAINEKQREVDAAKERYENELAAVKKTQAELKEKQTKVDKFLAQVK